VPNLHVVNPGLFTTIQDSGRWGHQSRGVPVSGAMDGASYRIANALVRNPPDAAALEVTMIGPELAFDDERVVAVAGAEFELTLDGRPVRIAEPFHAPRASCLRFGRRVRGARAYVAIGGGIDVPRVLGSRSTHVLSGLGGLQGRAVAAGDRLPLGNAEVAVVRSVHPPDARLPAVNEPTTLSVLPGPHVDMFQRNALDVLQSAPYEVDAKSDRMGYRLNGPLLRPTHGADIISEATPLGSVQVPGSGEPILLMADRQTIGGYSKIATVASVDIDRAGQLASGDRLSFTVCSDREALSALIAREQQLMALESAVSR